MQAVQLLVYWLRCCFQVIRSLIILHHKQEQKRKVPESAHSGKMPGDPSFTFNNPANSQGFSFGIIKAQSLESVSYRSEVQGWKTFRYYVTWYGDRLTGSLWNGARGATNTTFINLEENLNGKFTLQFCTLKIYFVGIPWYITQTNTAR